MIAQFCEQDYRHWDHHLDDFKFANNSARHESTGFTPSFLNFGRELEVPKALYRNEEPVPEEEPSNADREIRRNRLSKLQEVFDLVRVNLSHAFNSQSHYYNLRLRDWRCHVGDRVMKRENPLSSAVKGFAAKLAPKYSGPYTVVKVVSPVVYNLKSDTGKRVNRIHVKDLKPVPFTTELGIP
ncbi:uncharacterized protein LOC108908706 [Anoplophora glabripennis]|uniref:uncharacterized protein LOC108908706 n=1 Tax=Anoplophora glabripennis TaxID=217634 RepID=UPI000875689B|nr:uncharacterized protein LOC108908706 [Anoplophora glabripennis]